MDFYQKMALFDQFTSLLQIIIWPLVVLIILILLRTPIKKFLTDLSEINVKAGPIETTARRKQVIEAATSLGAAVAHWQNTASDSQGSP